MALTTRSAQAIGGPRGGTTWIDSGNDYSLGGSGTNGPTTFTATTSLPGNIVIQTIPLPNPFYDSVGNLLAVQDILDSSNQIQHLYGFQVCASAAFSAQTTLTLEASVYRFVGTTASTFAPGTVTSIPLAAPLTQTIASGQTLTITHTGATNTTLTLSAQAAMGSSTLLVNSVNLSSYAVGDWISWQVGGGAAFGWVGGSGGTPVLPLGVPIVSPIITNTALVTTNAIPWPGPLGTTSAQTGAIGLHAGDSIVLNCVTSTSTVASIPTLNISTLIT